MIFQYKDYNGKLAVCDIEIFDNVVVATELDGNPGASITNAAEMVATQVCTHFKINPEQLVWIEHYGPDGRRSDRYDRVEFEITPKGFRSPRWTHIASGNIREYINHHRIQKDKKVTHQKVQKAKKVEGQKVQSINEKLLQLPEVIFVEKSEFNKYNNIESVNESEYIVGGVHMYKIGHFRCDFDSDFGKMWVKWHDGIYYNKINTNFAIKAEIEAIMNRLRNNTFPNFQSIVDCCIRVSGSDSETRFMGAGHYGFYVLHLIPRRGDYNLYLHGYSI